jgi:hypothetical protein
MQQLIEKALAHVAKKHGVKVEELDYIGYTDLEYIYPGKGAKTLMFNIMKVNHVNYQGTVAYAHNQ